jgi:hypothetical protein
VQIVDDETWLAVERRRMAVHTKYTKNTDGESSPAVRERRKALETEATVLRDSEWPRRIEIRAHAAPPSAPPLRHDGVRRRGWGALVRGRSCDGRTGQRSFLASAR